MQHIDIKPPFAILLCVGGGGLSANNLLSALLNVPGHVLPQYTVMLSGASPTNTNHAVCWAACTVVRVLGG